MKKIFYSLLAVLISISAFSQIPNSGFENWTSTNFLVPAGWRIFGSASQYTPAVSGNYAVRIERNSFNLDEPGAIIYGLPDNNVFYGGIPFADRPDSLVGYFKYDIVPGDSAWVLIVFKYQGTPISQDLYYLTGSNTTNFTRKAFKINFGTSQVPDTLIIGVTSTNPDTNYQGSYVIVDSLHFTGTALTIPNGNFESWVNITDEEPYLWFTYNYFMFSNPVLPVTKTTDSYSGNYAIRLENLYYQGQYTRTYAMCGNQGDSAPLPGFPVTMRDSTLNGWYKFFPQNNDSLTIGVFMYYLGTQVGWGFFQSGIQKLTYTYFSVPIYYSGTFYGTPDSATVFVASFSTNGNYPPNGNSVLYVDNLTFDFVLDAPENLFSSKIMELNTYPNPFAGSVNISYILPESGNVTIKLYDVTGRELKLVYSGNQTTGKYSMLYDAVGLSNGIYQLVIQTKNYKQSRKVVVQK